MEIWKPISFAEGYSVSNHGRIKNKKGLIMKSHLLNAFYPCLTLVVDGKRKTFTIHRLVARFFCPGYDEDKIVNHKNGDKTDNNYTNLEWITQAENVQHCVDQGNITYRYKKVYEKDSLGNIINEFPSFKAANLDAKKRTSSIEILSRRSGRNFSYDKSDIKVIAEISGSIWKPLKDFEKRYEISNNGQIRNLQTNKMVAINFNGYCLAKVRNDEKWTQIAVHISVAKTFIPNPDNLAYVNHKDLNRRNNCIENLEWVSPKGNRDHFVKTLALKRVGKFSPEMILLEEYSSASDCSRKTGCAKTSLNRRLRDG